MKRIGIATVALLLVAGLPVLAQQVRIHTQDEMNREAHEINSHAGAEQYSSLEPFHRYTQAIETSALIPTSFPEEQHQPFYPRFKPRVFRL